MTQLCPICMASTEASLRYPRYVCRACLADGVEVAGKRVPVASLDVYMDQVECLVRGVRCRAREAYMGGVIVEPSEVLPRVVQKTARLVLRELAAGDAAFLVRLLNDQDFLRFIGDRSVRTTDDACAYLRHGPVASYREHGFGLYLVENTAGEPLGICGLLRRAELPDVDLGFAFLPEHRGHGYALEAAAATLAFGFEELRLPRIAAIVAPDNARSVRLLGKLGMRLVRTFAWPHGGATLELHAIDRAGRSVQAQGP